MVLFTGIMIIEPVITPFCLPSWKTRQRKHRKATMLHAEKRCASFSSSATTPPTLTLQQFDSIL
jgi:hypothetical protein